MQSNLGAMVSRTVAVLPLTSYATDTPLLRVPVPASPATGLATPSYAMLDRLTTASRAKVARVIGRADDATILAVNRALAVFLGIA